MGVLARRATSEDLASIGAIWQDFMAYLSEVNEDYWEVSDDRSSFVDYLRSVLDDADARVAVAEGTSTGVVGFALGLIETLPEWFGSHRVGLIRYVAVSPEAQDQGVGHELVGHLIDWYRGLEIKRVELYMLAGLPAEGFWIKQGFKPFMDRRFITL